MSDVVIAATTVPTGNLGESGTALLSPTVGSVVL